MYNFNFNFVMKKHIFLFFHRRKFDFDDEMIKSLVWSSM